MDSRANLKRMKENSNTIDVNTKVKYTIMTNKDKKRVDSIVTHKETESTNDMTYDHQECDLITLKKPVDKIHNSSLVILGKKTKKN